METPSKTYSLRHPVWLLVVAVVLMFSGCAMVGPNYVRPDIPAPDAWHAQLKDGLSAAETNPQTLARWWTTLDDPVLSNLIKRGVEGNLDLKDARARVREARAARTISKAGLYPAINASGSATKSRGSEERGSGKEVDLYSAGFDAGWELDLFGGIRRSVEAATADLEASQEDLGDVLVSLLAEIALNYVDARTFQTRLSVAEANLRAQQETYDLARSRYQAGLSTELAVEQARYNLESTRSQMPTLKPCRRASSAAAVPAGPPPMIARSSVVEPPVKFSIAQAQVGMQGVALPRNR